MMFSSTIFGIVAICLFSGDQILGFDNTAVTDSFEIQGKWKFKTDPGNKGINENWASTGFDDSG